MRMPFYMTINFTCSCSRLISTKGDMDINEHERLFRLILITRQLCIICDTVDDAIVQKGITMTTISRNLFVDEKKTKRFPPGQRWWVINVKCQIPTHDRVLHRCSLCLSRPPPTNLDKRILFVDETNKTFPPWIEVVGNQRKMPNTYPWPSVSQVIAISVQTSSN